MIKINHDELIKMSAQDVLDSDISTENPENGYISHYRCLTKAQANGLLIRFTRAIGYELNSENAYFICNDHKKLLVNATAGAGKTTTVLIKLYRLLIMKGVTPRKIGVFSYNTASVKDLQKKFKDLAYSINLAIRNVGIYLEPSEFPDMRTLNSLTFNILKSYGELIGLSAFDIASSGVQSSTMAETILEVSKNDKIDSSAVEELLGLYDLINETLEPLEYFEDQLNDYQTRYGLTKDKVQDILKLYRLKLQYKTTPLVHQSDTCRIVLEGCEKNEEFKKHVEKLYEYVICDEVQDISEATTRLLKIMSVNSLWVIGDGDQSIYSFKGSRPNNCQRLAQEIEDTEICYLSANRRCPENILEMGKLCLKEMTDRDNVMPVAIKTRGVVNNIFYENKLDAIQKITAELKNLTVKELKECTIGYRKNSSAYYIVNELLKNDIPFIIKDDFQFGKDILSTSLEQIIQLILKPSRVDLAYKSMYKILPIKKQLPLEMVKKVLKKEYKADQITSQVAERYLDAVLEDLDSYDVFEIPSNYFILNKGSNEEEFNQACIKIQELRKVLKKEKKLNSAFNKIKDLFTKYYWGFIRTKMQFPAELEEQIINDWNCDLSFAEFTSRRAKQLKKINECQAKQIGVTLSTMHGLKGLEFDRVYLIELDNNNLPYLKPNKNYTERELEETINETLRLLYVGITRAKEEVNLYWDNTEQNKSPFIGLTSEYRPTKIEEREDLSEEFNLDLDSIELEEILEEPENEMFNLNLDIDLDMNLEDITLEEPIQEPIQVEEPTQVEEIKLVEETKQIKEDNVVTSLFETTVSDYLEETEDLLHPDEDFEEVPKGEELQSILKLIAKDLIV